MSLNELGGFLSGATAPIAFLWLIIGYTLQRKELKANTTALNIQQKEMEKQATELAKQTEHLRETAKATKLQGTMAILKS